MLHISSVAYLGFGKGGHGERAEREPITGVWGRKQSPWSESQGAKPPPLEAETVFAFERSMEAANSPIFFWNLETQKITASYQMQSHMAILIAYCIGTKKKNQTLSNFAILAGKRQKNAPFNIKSPVKNFHGRAKVGAIAPWPSP